MVAAVRPGIGQPEHEFGLVIIVVDVVEVAVGEVEQRHVEQLAALVLQQRVVHDVDRLGPGRCASAPIDQSSSSS